MNTKTFAVIIAGTLIIGGCGSPKEGTLGIGVYPGNPMENFSPEVKNGGGKYRNIALFRAAKHSSSADYNQTAQLVTDGIIDTVAASPVKIVEYHKKGLPSVDWKDYVMNFVSTWKSEGVEDEWISIDLGSRSSFNKMRFAWINGAENTVVQCSDDGKDWKDITTFKGAKTEVAFSRAKGRYVRLLLKKALNGRPFELSEWEVYGMGGTRAVAKRSPQREGNRQMLSGGWKLFRAPQVTAVGREISSIGFDDSDWLEATVPGTVLGSYVDVGAVAHPNYEANQLYISDSYFRSDFWYRHVFEAKPNSARQFLHFEGINYRAEVYLNGRKMGMIDGAFRSKDFDVTGTLVKGENVLAVRIIHNRYPGEVKVQDAYSPKMNGGILGAENPTMHASIGWDWIPTVRGRNIGIYDDVWLDFTGPVKMEDPFVRTELPLPDTTRASVFAQVSLVNNSDEEVDGVLRWRFGDLEAVVPITLKAWERRFVDLEPQTLENPHLWWPNGYGEQYLYPVRFEFDVDGSVSDKCEFLSGVRQMTYTVEPYVSQTGGSAHFRGREENTRLSLYVNGRRLIGFGGNWGFPEHMLNYRAREFDIAVGYHADMNFTMIRNWVGMTGHRAFYEACDRHGIVIWQDFWLANPWDGPDPDDSGRFNEIATEYVRRIRNHPSLGLYVGRNEGYPPEDIDTYLDKMVQEEHPGLMYISHSATDGVSGGGPYRALLPSEYFHIRGMDKLHSEMGMPNVMSYEGMKRAMGEENLEPVNTMAHPNDMYGLHDYALGRVASSAQQTESFNELIANAFGEPSDAREFSELAQWINYDGYRAMFEGRSQYRRGLLLWMSHPAWPSMVWQTYDYFFEPTAAYFGCKKACEPIHILLNQYTREVDVVNYRAGDRTGLTADLQILDMNGVETGRDSCKVDIAEDSTVHCFALAAPDADVYYVKLALRDSVGTEVSSNFYVQGREEGNFKALRSLGKASVQASVSGGRVMLENTGDIPALMVRLNLKDLKDCDQILPVWYSDNYIALMPGESRSIDISVRTEDLRGPAFLEVSGFNLELQRIVL